MRVQRQKVATQSDLAYAIDDLREWLTVQTPVADHYSSVQRLFHRKRLVAELRAKRNRENSPESADGLSRTCTVCPNHADHVLLVDEKGTWCPYVAGLRLARTGRHHGNNNIINELLEKARI